MLSAWILIIEKKPELIASLRTVKGLQAAFDENHLWLKGDGQLALDHASVQKVSAIARYRLDDQGRMFRNEELTPSANLPNLDWQPLSVFIPIDSSESAIPAGERPQAEIRLVPGKNVETPAAMLLPFDQLADYIETASSIRFKHLRFAVSEKGEALVKGEPPLLPLPGKFFWQQGSLLLPGGQQLERPSLAALLERNYRQAYPEVAFILVKSEVQVEMLKDVDFHTLSRSAVRNTGKGASHE
jgi:hypothetical protein